MTSVYAIGLRHTRIRADSSQYRDVFLVEVFEEDVDLVDKLIGILWPEDQIMAMLEAWEAAEGKVPPGGSLLLLRTEEEYRHKHIRAKDARHVFEYMVWAWPSGSRPRDRQVERALQTYEYVQESAARGGLLKSPWGGG